MNSLRTKLIFPVAVVVIFGICMFIELNIHIGNLHQSGAEIANHYLVSVQLLGKIREEASDMQTSALYHVMADEAEGMQMVEEQITAWCEEIEANCDELNQNLVSGEEAEAFQEMKVKMDEYFGCVGQAVTMSADG